MPKTAVRSARPSWATQDAGRIRPGEAGPVTLRIKSRCHCGRRSRAATLAQVDEAREQFCYPGDPGTIQRIGTGSECKILLPDLESERHPDLAIYMTPQPAGNVWENLGAGDCDRSRLVQLGHRITWKSRTNIGNSASASMDHRDERQEMLVRRRSTARWLDKVGFQRRSAHPLLPGFEFDLSRGVRGGQAGELNANQQRLGLESRRSRSGPEISYVENGTHIGPPTMGRMTLDEFDLAEAGKVRIRIEQRGGDRG